MNAQTIGKHVGFGDQHAELERLIQHNLKEQPIEVHLVALKNTECCIGQLFFERLTDSSGICEFGKENIKKRLLLGNPMQAVNDFVPTHRHDSGGTAAKRILGAD